MKSVVFLYHIGVHHCTVSPLSPPRPCDREEGGGGQI